MTNEPSNAASDYLSMVEGFKAMRTMFTAYLDAGFTEKQAMSLLLNAMNQGVERLIKQEGSEGIDGS